MKIFKDISDTAESICLRIEKLRSHIRALQAIAVEATEKFTTQIAEIWPDSPKRPAADEDVTPSQF
jgi:hypothetical protein